MNDTPDPSHIQPLAKAFYQSQYHIGDLLERMFSADWFYAAANMGTRIKSPIELLAGLKRTLGLTLENDQPMLVVSEGPGADAVSAPERGRLARGPQLDRLVVLGVSPAAAPGAAAQCRVQRGPQGGWKTNLAPSVPRAERTFRQQVKARVQLAPVQQLLAGTAPAAQPAVLSRLLLQAPIRPDNLALLEHAAAAAPADGRLRALVTSLLSLPEYQLM